MERRRLTQPYGVGYKRPPKGTQFQPGQSGNPRGRPKGTQNLATDLKDELGERIPVREGGKERKLSKQRVIIKALVAKAAKGDARAMSTLLGLILKVLGETFEPEMPEILSDADEAILQRYVARAQTDRPPRAKAKSHAATDKKRREAKS